MQPLFSLIAPIYNVEKYLPMCVDSMLKQSFDNIEIILVDDGSPDSCPQLCDEYGKNDSRIIVIHKGNGGLVSARQAGAQIAKGKYIICVDGDDWLEPDYCEEMARIIKKYNIDIVCCGYYLSYPNKKVEVHNSDNRVGKYSRKQIEEEILPHLFQDKKARQFGLSMWAKAVKTELMVEFQMKVPQDISIGEDAVCMGPCIFHANSLYILDKPLYNYRQNNESMTKSGKVYSWEGPEKRGRLLEEVIDVKWGDMRDQIYRGVVHSLFNVVKSQFNRTDSDIKSIRENILLELDREYYKECIKNAHFVGVKANVMKYLLSLRLLKIIEILNSH